MRLPSARFYRRVKIMAKCSKGKQENLTGLYCNNNIRDKTKRAVDGYAQHCING